MDLSLLRSLTGPHDLKSLSPEQVRALAQEVRQEILRVVSANGGHLASNLGVVELTIALHRVFSCPHDVVVWDVGHQCYAHKLLTGRAGRFHTLRQKDGISGFPRRDESPYDAFGTGHSSTALSAASGILSALRYRGKSGKVVAVVGDGALTAGLAFEALLNVGRSCSDLIVILNDNKMSISPNTGSFSRYLSTLTVKGPYQKLKTRLRRALQTVPLVGRPACRALSRLKRSARTLLYQSNIFADFGFEYVGPLNGHHIEDLERVLNDAKKLTRPTLLHVQTVKGKGYPFAEQNPTDFHGVGPFNLAEGIVEKKDALTFTEAFSHTLLNAARTDDRVVAITAAMTGGTGLGLFSHIYPERFFDVGIAEQHAVTFAAGLACAGVKPVVAVYSTFLQRAVDQVIHDVAVQNLPVIFALDRAGAVPHDGETHQGLFDLSILRAVPNINILCPASAHELSLLFGWALAQDTPVAIRYPKALCPPEEDGFSTPVHTGRGVLITRENECNVLLVCTGGVFPE
ncbi:1-deoxy-D-xylulose-5-phosphate synthase, partial [Treponema pallidum]